MHEIHKYLLLNVIGINITLFYTKKYLSFTITYFSETGTAVTSSPQSVKAIELSFSTAVGSTASGTLARYTTVSPRIVLRNKPALQ